MHDPVLGPGKGPLPPATAPLGGADTLQRVRGSFLGKEKAGCSLPDSNWTRERDYVDICFTASDGLVVGRGLVVSDLREDALPQYHRYQSNFGAYGGRHSGDDHGHGFKQPHGGDVRHDRGNQFLGQL